MRSDQTSGVREAVGVFDTAEAFQDAVDDLMTSGFDRAEISMVASESAVEEKLGHKYEKSAECEDDCAIPRTAYVSPESIGEGEGAIIGGLLYVGAGVGAVLASAGPLATAMLLGGGAGMVIGAVLAKIVGERHARYLQEQIDRGGLLLWVRTWDEADERRAVGILEKHSGKDVHVHGANANA